MNCSEMATSQSRHAKLYVYLSLIALILIVVCMAVPARNIPWSLIDDGGWCSGLPKAMNEAISAGKWVSFDHRQIAFFGDSEKGRFRPLFAIFAWTQYQLWHRNVAGMRITRVALLAVIAVCLWFVARRVTRSTLAGFLGSLFYLLYAPGMHNFYRLGTQESLASTLLACYLAAAVWVGTNEKRPDRPRWWALLPGGLLLVMALLSRETAIFVAPTTMTLAVLVRVRCSLPDQARLQRTLNVYAGIGIIMAVALVIVGLVGGVASGNHAQGYHPTDILLIARNIIWLSWALFRVYGLLLVVALASFGYRLFQIIRARQSLSPAMFWQTGFLAWFLWGWLIQLPYISPFERYLSPYVIGLSLFLGCEIARFIHTLCTVCLPRWRRMVWALILAAISFEFVVQNSLEIAASARYFAARDGASNMVVSYLAQNVPPKGRVWVNLPDGSKPGPSEWFNELRLHLPEFYDRSDLSVLSLDLSNEAAYQSGDWIVTWAQFSLYSPQALQDSMRGWQVQEFTVPAMARFPALWQRQVERMMMKRILWSSTLPRQPGFEIDLTWHVYQLK